MFAATKKSVLTGLSMLVWLTAAIPANATETEAPLSITELTQAAVALRHNLLSAEETFFRLNPNTLTIYVNIDNLPATMFKDISITLDGKTIVQHSFSEREYQFLNKGAMKKIYAAAITPGQHEVVTIINSTASSAEQNKTTLTLEKGVGHDTLKVTVANPLQKQRPELFFEQEKGVAQ